MMLHNMFLFAAVFLAYFIKGITGFGNTLVMGPLFSFAISNRLTTPIDLLFSMPTNGWIVLRERRNISPKIVIPLSLMLLAGIIPGTFLLKAGSDWILKSILGVVVVGLAFELMTRKQVITEGKKLNPAFLVIIGITSGILAGMFGISALLIAYISRTTETRGQFRANMCCVFLADNLFRFVTYWLTGILTGEVLRLALLLSPAVILGMAAGFRVEAGLGEKTVKKTVIVLLICSGLTLFIKSMFFH